MDSATPIWSLLSAALLGLLIGLERERKRNLLGSIVAGVRTFPLIALIGSSVGQLSAFTPLLPIAGFLAITTLIGLAYWRSSEGEKMGATTEVAALVAFGLGVLAGYGEFVVALAGAVITTGILSLREELRSFVGAITREDLFATVQFLALSLVILPLVPNRSLGPWGVWNPRTIWLLVVLISGISFVGYIATKIVGTRRGIGISGLLGGLASSTAVTLSFSEQSRKQTDLSHLYSVGVFGASAIAAPRLLFLIGVVQPALIPYALVPLGTLLLIPTLMGLIMAKRLSATEIESIQLTNPFELRPALQFAALFVLILLLTRAADEFFGQEGLYLAIVLAGVTQLDAVTLSLGKQIGGGLDYHVASKSLAIAIASNNVFKAALALAIGSRPFGRIVTGTLLLTALGCIAVTWFLLPRLPL
ncbi:MAG: MgtC/SapB family protein [Trueperaceae bacterium]|nr:MAG: MgtC/SapB family protein [Trueperaceae bacterium]